MESLKILLTEVGRIVQLDAKQREEREKRGELFNIFEILKVETNETRAHSAFLAALLTPKGKHGAGDRFLRAFIDTMDCLKDFEFDTKDAKVEIEYWIGNKNEDATEGGRIDILITSTDGKAVIIENKIYAGDQEKQLVRYNNYAKKVYRDYRLLYLNLFGSKASEYSVKDESGEELQADDDYSRIGYDKEIIDWLDACIADAARLPLVRESVIQYQNLIKKLTNQNMEKEYREQMFEAMTASMDSTITIAEQLNNWQDYIIEKYLFSSLKEWADKNNLIFEHKSSRNFYFYKDGWEKCFIQFLAGARGWCGRFEYGIYLHDVETKDIPQLQNQPKIFQNNPDLWWPYGRTPFEQYADWTYDIMKDIKDGKVAAYLIKKAEYMLSQIEEHNLLML